MTTETDKVRVEPGVIWEGVDNHGRKCQVVLRQGRAHGQKRPHTQWGPGEWREAPWGVMPVSKIIADLYGDAQDLAVLAVTGND